MDEVLFRRLIGAAVLLALALGLASLLPGPDRGGALSQQPVVAYDLRTGQPLMETVPLPPVRLKPVEIGPTGQLTPPEPPAPKLAEGTSPPAGADASTAPAKAPATASSAKAAPATAPAAKAADTPAPVPGMATAAPAKTAPPTVRPVLKVDEHLGASVNTSWYVQIASFGSRDNARAVLQKLFNQGMPAMIQTVPMGKKLWYRVRVGPYSSEGPAQQALAAVRKQGYASARVVRPDVKGN